MALIKIRLLQIGDVHLPSVINERRNIDDKDPKFSVELKNRISASPTKVVYQKIFSLIENAEYDAVLFMGDLTDRGNLDGYKSAVSFIANALQLGGERKNKDTRVGIVAGNHDIDRNLATKPNITEKFRPLNESLVENSLPCLPVDSEECIDLSKGHANASIKLLNSCWGCGIKENIPEMFREALHGAITKLMQDPNSSEYRQYYDRQLDTPAFSNETIARIVEERCDTPEDTVDIYVAHHNLLPQRTPRLAPYTELVNSGSLRAALTDGRKPTIYLHGHIHEDPVEIVSTPSGANLVTISAPLSSQGFNEVEVIFTGTGLPLTCAIVPWRFNASGVLFKQPRQTVQLLSGRRRSRDASLPKLLSFILERREVYWSDLQRHDPPFYEIQTDETLEEGLEMLLADQTVSVENYGMSPKNWIVRSNL